MEEGPPVRKFLRLAACTRSRGNASSVSSRLARAERAPLFIAIVNNSPAWRFGPQKRESTSKSVRFNSANIFHAHEHDSNPVHRKSHKFISN